MKRKLIEIAREDGRYNAGALKFIYEGLAHTVKNFSEKPQHVSGRMLCEGLQDFAIQKWGRLSLLVLNSWGVKTTRDFGEIVYLMIKNDWLSTQPADTIDDFNNVYDFKTVFNDQFKFTPANQNETDAR
jgi:uncharacterized repeat protein (TIGR04138 family)